MTPRLLASLAFVAALSLVTNAVPAQQLDRTGQLLQQLSEAPGPSGFEEPVRKLMVGAMKPFATEPLRYDGVGDVIAQQGSTGPRVMVDAHMDELGGMVRRITPNGFLSMQMLGGWLDAALVDQRWIILGSKGPVHAVTGIRDVHVVPAEDRSRLTPRDAIFLDIGARNPADAAAMGIEPGDPVIPDSPFLVLNGTDNYLGKAWDDRVGLAVMVEAMRRTASMPHPNTLIFVATVQEEVGLRGARAATQTVKPDAGVALEGGIAGDMPGARPEETQARIGSGPSLFLYDSSTIANRKFVSLFRDTAKDDFIPLQFDLVQGYGDDSAEMQTASGGVPTVNLTVPVRYTHAHNGIMNRKDFDHTVDLLVAVLMKLDAKTVADLRDFTPKD